MQIQAHLWKKRKQTPSFLVFHQQVSCIRWARPPIKLDRIIYFTQNYPTFLLLFSGKDLCTVSNYTICPRLPRFSKHLSS